MSDGSTFLGHASVVAEVAGLRVGFDCHLGGDVFQTWRFVPELTPPGLLDVLCISHSHQDHVDARVISAMDEGMLVCIPSQRPQLREAVGNGWPAYPLKLSELPHWTPVRLSRGVTLTCIPSDRNDTDAAWLLQAPSGFSLWHGNDAFMRRETLERVRRELAPDGVRHVYAPFAFVHWYPFCVETLSSSMRSAEAARCVAESVAAMRIHGEVLGADIMIPCGGNLAPMHGSREHADSVLTPYEAGGIQVRDGLVSGMGSVGDYAWSVATPALGIGARALIDAARAERRAEAVEYADTTASFGLRWFRALPEASVYGTIEGPGRIHLMDKATGDELMFHLEPAIWNAWVAGRASFDDVLGSGAFKVWRTPEHFNAPLFARLRRWL